MVQHKSVLHSFLRLTNIPLWGYTTFYLSINRHLGCFQSPTIINNTVRYIYVRVFVWTYVSNSPGYIPQCRIAGP